MVATLKTREGSRFSELERLRRPPTGTAFARALEWVDEIGVFRLGRPKLSQSRRIGWRRWPVLAGVECAAAGAGRGDEAYGDAHRSDVALEGEAIDEALDLFQILMATRLRNVAERKTDKERLSTLSQLEKASRTLARAAKALFEELELPDAAGRVEGPGRGERGQAGPRPPGAGPAEGGRQAVAAARGGRQAHASRVAQGGLCQP
ncbi:hypothetical protein HET69_29095 [Streptomyces sp. CJ_13]|nr:hypothetical protein [Streptomyces sp. CJ_13]MBT1187928.1 hypothetical protein [Streptomyces sp. CJ_13]